MSLKSFASRIFAKRIQRHVNRWASQPLATQERVFKNLIEKAKHTDFGKDHDFEAITTHKDFVTRVPIRDYEQLRPYIDRVVTGEADVLWPGKPLYFAKTSGTTSGAKYIPLTKESMPTHPNSARNAILMYIAQTGNTRFVDGKMIFLQGSPEVQEKNGIMVGRLSGIVAHYVPNYLQKNRLPSWETNCIENWEAKVDAVVEETINQNMTLIGGIPPWVQMYYDKLIAKSGKAVGDLFKSYSLFVYGGVNYEPYRAKFEKMIGRRVDSIELYPASEGFFAFQDTQDQPGMLLQLDNGIFYEFVEATTFFDEHPKRITLEEVVIGINYVMIISTTAGLWGYNIGDTVQFTSTTPYRIMVSGRIKHFISAFGEHVIGKEVEQAMQEAMDTSKLSINEFTVAPQINPEKGLPYHEWLIEFEKEPENDEEITAFAKALDLSLQSQNSYYFDLIEGKVLRPLVITKVSQNGFNKYMKSIGKLGGQNKIPRLSNDRKIADALPLD